MAQTFKNLQDSVLHHIGDVSGLTRVKVKRWLNDSRNELWEILDGEWKRATDYLTTTIAYSTGTCDATKGNTTVSGTGTVWTSDMAGRFMQIDGDDPWYKIASVTSGTELELEDAFLSTTDTEMSFNINTYLYSINSNVQRIVQVAIEDDIRWSETEIISASDFYARVAVPLNWGVGGLPRIAWLDDPDSSNVYKLGIWYPPETATLVKYRYFKNPTEMSSDSDTVLIPGGDSWVLADTVSTALNFKDRMPASSQWLQKREIALERLLATVGRQRRVTHRRKDHTDAGLRHTRVSLGPWFPDVY